ncbi:DNRLRE domain-containing protein [Micromonospora sp. LOL_023]|uniref:DNRLRE domain-containing protein n=1 Tax=Micromonospora sp. LOL_023 TaxID=3345418 RepID=UPI003A8890A8
MATSQDPHRRRRTATTRMFARWRRCAGGVAVVAAALVGLSSSVPPGAVPADGEFPVGWLTSWIDDRPGWLPWGGPAAAELPVSPVGDGAGPGGYTSPAATRAGGGAGTSQRLVDGLPGYAGQLAADESVTPVTAARHDPATSRHDARSSRSTMTVYDNADGSTTAQLSTGQVNYQAADGSWQPIDPTLVRRGGRWGVTDNPMGVSLGATSGTAAASDTAAGQPLVELPLPGGGVLGWSLAGAAAVTPVVDGATATYRQVLPGTDLELVARPDGVKETLILASPQAGSEWVFPLTLRGVTARIGSAGSAELVDNTGAVVASIPPAFMQDSSVDAKTGLPAQSAAVSMDLVQVDGGPALRLVADRGWLADPARVFPVRVDPTVTTGPDGDVFVDSDPATGATVQNGNHLQVGYSGGVGSRTFLNFDVSSAVTDAKPIIASAYLRLFLNHRVRCDAKDLQVGLVEQEWTVAELATAALPGPDLEPGSVRYRYYTDNGQACANPSAGPTSGQWVQVDVRELISGWAVGQRNLGLALIDDERVLASGARFTSANHGNGAYAPRLELTMTANLPPQVSHRSPVHGAVVSTLTPRLYVRGHDPDKSGTVRYKLWLHDDAGTVLHVTEGTGSYYDVPAGLLRSNKQYSWTVQPFDGAVYGARYPRYTFYTRVPQPALGSRLVQNPGVGYHPEIGNYTTTVTEAQVAGVGPELAITRSYNTLDTRRSGAFGQGWSSLLDAQVTGRTSTTDALRSAVVTYPDGSEAGFGPTSDGSFVPPPGRYEVLTEVRSGTSVTGYRLTVKHGTTYVFGRSAGLGVFRLTAVTDANGRTLTATYNGSGLVSKLTNAAGRSLTLTWAGTASPSTGSHVTRVTTDAPAAGGSGYVWQYTYGSHDRLTKACTPVSACTTYGWGNDANQGANAVRNHAVGDGGRPVAGGHPAARCDAHRRGGARRADHDGVEPGDDRVGDRPGRASGLLLLRPAVRAEGVADRRAGPHHPVRVRHRWVHQPGVRPERDRHPVGAGRTRQHHPGGDLPGPGRRQVFQQLLHLHVLQQRPDASEERPADGGTRAGLVQRAGRHLPDAVLLRQHQRQPAQHGGSARAAYGDCLHHRRERPGRAAHAGAGPVEGLAADHVHLGR